MGLIRASLIGFACFLVGCIGSTHYAPLYGLENAVKQYCNDEVKRDLQISMLSNVIEGRSILSTESVPIPRVKPR